MKKLFSILYLVMIFSCIRVYATPISYPRTKNDLKLPSDVEQQSVDIDTLLKIPAVDANAKIYDFADLLTDAEESKLFIQLNDFRNNTGLDAVIVLINDSQGLSLKDYTYGFYDYNDFDKLGVSFVIYVGSDRKSVFMGNNGSPGSNVYKAYPDRTVTSIVKYVYTNHIDKDDYMGACETYIKLIDGFYIKAFGSYVTKPNDVQEKSIPWIEIIVISFVLTLIITVSIDSKQLKPKIQSDQSIKKSLDYSTMIVKCEYDKPIPVNNIGKS